MLRGDMNDRRKNLVRQAFSILDKDNSGAVDFNDIKDTYDASKHPDVISKKRTAEAILLEFLDTFDVGGVKDGVVTFDEFCNYYANISASIDDDDYFELMIRNAWHISGGEGWSANTANRRVLATGKDGRQTVEEVKNDLGARDSEELLRRLRLQGIDVSGIDERGGMKETKVGSGRGSMPKGLHASQQRGQAATASGGCLSLYGSFYCCVIFNRQCTQASHSH